MRSCVRRVPDAPLTSLEDRRVKDVGIGIGFPTIEDAGAAAAGACGFCPLRINESLGDQPIDQPRDFPVALRVRALARMAKVVICFSLTKLFGRENQAVAVYAPSFPIAFGR